MHSIYSLVFFDSLRASFFVALHSESAWFAALAFGNYNMLPMTLAAFAGSTVGMCVNFWLGYYITRWRYDLPVYDEKLYQRICGYFRKNLFLLMAIPPLYMFEVIPGLGLFVFINGMFRVPPLRAIIVIMIARAWYYGNYLFQT